MGDSKDVQYYFEVIGDAYNRGRFEAALQFANEGIEKHPFSAVLYTSRGEVFTSMKCLENAIKDFEVAVQFGMGNAALHSLGICHLAKNDFDKAIECFSEAIELGNAHINTYLARADAFRSKGKSELAKIDENKASEMYRSVKTRCDLHGLDVVEVNTKKRVEFSTPSEEAIFIMDHLKPPPKSLCPWAGEFLPDGQSQSSDGEWFFNKILVCNECKKLKDEWLNQQELILSQIYRDRW